MRPPPPHPRPPPPPLITIPIHPHPPPSTPIHLHPSSAPLRGAAHPRRRRARPTQRSSVYASPRGWVRLPLGPGVWGAPRSAPPSRSAAPPCELSIGERLPGRRPGRRRVWQSPRETRGLVSRREMASQPQLLPDQNASGGSRSAGAMGRGTGLAQAQATRRRVARRGLAQRGQLMGRPAQQSQWHSRDGPHSNRRTSVAARRGKRSSSRVAAARAGPVVPSQESRDCSV